MKILLFTGAGLSVPLGLPTTKDFQTLLDRGISTRVMSFMRTFLGNNYKDIEHVLSTLEMFIGKDTFIDSIVKRESDSKNEYREVFKDLKSMKDEAVTLIKEIKQGIFSSLVNYDRANGKELYINLLRQLNKQFETLQLSIFTTNYDLTFEDAIEMADDEIAELGIKNVDYGFETTIGKRIFSKEIDYTWTDGTIEYKKLHGSLDWIMDHNKKCTRSGSSTVPLDPASMPLLYPGYKETPTTEPFMTLHDQLFARLMQADIVISIGFAFRDPFINNLFDAALKTNDKTPHFCFNPCALKDLPAESSIGYFVANHRNFKHIPLPLKLQENPIDYDFALLSIMEESVDGNNPTHTRS